jgi:hypothetical protein
VTERHLAPEEVQLLAEGERASGWLLEHLERCVHCHSEVEAERRLVSQLESLPRLQPAPLFTYRVMRQVNVFEPWYVALADTIRKLTPRSRSGRIAASVLAAVAALVITAGSLWVARNLALLAFLAGVVASRVRQTVAQTLLALADALGIASQLQGTQLLVVTVVTTLLTVLGVAAALRYLLAGARRPGDH